MRARIAKRVDENQSKIVEQLRKCGYAVAITSMVGEGFPDIVVSSSGKNFLFEIKDGNKSPSQRKLTPDEVKFHDRWRGQISVITTVDEAIEIVNEYLKK